MFIEQLTDKFIIINYKRFEEVEKLSGNPEMDMGKCHPAIANLLGAIDNFRNEYQKITGNPMNQLYMACNIDEPYAEKVAELILSGEN